MAPKLRIIPSSIPAAKCWEGSSPPTVILGRVVDSNGSAVKNDIIHIGEGFVGLRLTRESHKAKASAAIRIAIFDDDCFFNTPKP